MYWHVFYSHSAQSIRRTFKWHEIWCKSVTCHTCPHSSSSPAPADVWARYFIKADWSASTTATTQHKYCGTWVQCPGTESSLCQHTAATTVRFVQVDIPSVFQLFRWGFFLMRDQRVWWFWGTELKMAGSDFIGMDALWSMRHVPITRSH